MLALASMLAPLLVLQGLKNGVTEGMRERLLQDPGALIITPKSDAGSYDADFIDLLSSLPGASYAIGRTRETAADLTLANEQEHTHTSIALEPATPGEPVLVRYHMTAPENGDKPQIVLSASAAAALKIARGGCLVAKLGRRTPAGKLESFPLEFQVADILPAQAGDRKFAFVPLQLLEDMENYRDNIAVPSRGMTGSARPGPRKYASFRLYARELNDVQSLARWLEGKNIEVMTRARDIAAIQSLEAAINQIILIISLAVGLGFAAFTISSSEGAVRRKIRMLGMLRLLGFQRGPLICYPATQTLLTAICGFALSLLIYVCVAFTIDRTFASNGGLACKLEWGDALWAFLIVILISALSSARAAWQASSLEPSLVIREV